MAGERIVEAMFDAANAAIPVTERTDVVWGTVLTPLPNVTVQVDGEQNMTLQPNFLKLSPLCMEKWFTIPAWTTLPESEHTHGYEDSDEGSTETKTTEPGTPHLHSIAEHRVMVWRGLLAGDRVMMLRYKNGDQFYILQREGDL